MDHPWRPAMFQIFRITLPEDRRSENKSRIQATICVYLAGVGSNANRLASCGQKEFARGFWKWSRFSKPFSVSAGPCIHLHNGNRDAGFQPPAPEILARGTRLSGFIIVRREELLLRSARRRSIPRPVLNSRTARLNYSAEAGRRTAALRKS
jgi:hypothetical protein